MLLNGGVEEDSWTARRSNWSILKHISPGCSLEGLMFKLKLQYFAYLLWRTDSFEKTLMLGKTKGRRRRGRQRMRCLDGITDQWTWIWASSGRWWWTGRPGVLWSMRSQRIRHDWVTELNWNLRGSVIWSRYFTWSLSVWERNLWKTKHRFCDPCISLSLYHSLAVLVV